MTDFSGFVSIDKPVNLSSFSIVSQVRKITGLKKAGHTGTLDPFATGVLVVALGPATKLIRFLNEDKKDYQAEMQVGLETDTLDLTGTVISRKTPEEFSEQELLNAFRNFTGRFLQSPPQFSAKKIKGKSAYKYARSGKPVYIPPCEVEIFSIDLISYQFPYINFRVSCSKGTYIRALCRDLAMFLGTKGTLLKLRRLSSGPFTTGTSICFNEMSKTLIIDQTVPAHTALSHIPDLPVEPEEIPLLLNGIPPSRDRYREAGLASGIFKVHRIGEFIIILEYEDIQGFKFLRVVKFL